VCSLVAFHGNSSAGEEGLPRNSSWVALPQYAPSNMHPGGKNWGREKEASRSSEKLF